jgi:hypothetical protein
MEMKAKKSKSLATGMISILLLFLAGAIGQGYAATDEERVMANDRDLILEPNSEAKIMRALPQDITGDHRSSAERLVKESVRAIRADDGPTSGEKVEELRKVMMRIQDPPWAACDQICKGLIIGGDPQKYAICYLACIINGGPKANLIPIVPGPDHSR